MLTLSEMRRRHTKTHLYVLRVQDEGGFGPFSNCSIFLMCSKKHPGANEDGISANFEGLYGCKNSRQLQHWFGPFWDRLRGQYICLYKVPREKVCVGKTQVLFDREAAELVKKAAVSELIA